MRREPRALAATSTCPYAWRLERLFVVNAGTCSSLRLRGNTKACYNIIRIEDDRVQVARKYPFHGDETLIELRAVDGVVRQVHLPRASRRRAR